MQETAIQAGNDVELVHEAANARGLLETEVHKRIIGHSDVIRQMLVSLFANGHALLMGVPGLAKTMLVRTLAESMNLSFGRIQFTPDLMPSDITGTDILEESSAGGRSFRFVPGPLFCQLLLADEVNRTPPKTQAALLQAMQEKTVTAGGKTHRLDPPFLVFATRNPIEQEGTYPLPEAQLDRFMLEITVTYPSMDEEALIVNQPLSDEAAPVDRVIDVDRLLELQSLVRRVPAAAHVVNFAVRLVRNTRPGEKDAPEKIRRLVTWGAGPRAAQMLMAASRANAVLDGRYAVSVEDVEAMSHSVLRHRLVTTFHAQAEGIKKDELVSLAVSEAKKHIDL